MQAIKMGSSFWKWIAAAIAALVMAGCSVGDPPDETLGWSPEKLYADAREDMDGGRWDAALKTLEKLEARYPFGRWAQQAQIDSAYANYRQGERALALAATDRFIKLHPNHASLDYVYYLRGLINFNEQDGWIARLGGQDLSERDQQAARDAFDAFKEVVTRFPESKYAPDSEARMKYLVNAMASGEVHIARHYYRNGAYVAAANRAQNAIRRYPQAPATEEALFILMSSQEKLGLTELRNDTRRVLEGNFPKSPWLAGDASEKQRWWQIWR